jgi:hypothetical protein
MINTKIVFNFEMNNEPKASKPEKETTKGLQRLKVDVTKVEAKDDPIAIIKKLRTILRKHNREQE